MNFNSKLGFTLIELSIVIVIIGLIVAGVVSGQSLITQAKLRSVASEYNKYDSATNTFYLEYNALQGDMSNAWEYFQSGCSSQTHTNSAYNCQGSGNKRINWEDMNNSPAYDNHENFLSWAHLSFAEIIEGFYSGNNDSGGANAMRAGLNIPASAFGNGGWVFNSDTRWRDDLSISIAVKNQLIVGAHVQGERSYGALFTPSQAKSFDEKLDDGKPFTGKVIGLVGYNGGASYDSNCSDGAGGVDEKYLLTETGSRCVLAIHLSRLNATY